MKVSHGYSRTVLLIGQYAVKVPCVGKGWRSFLCGMLSNMAERDRWRATRHPRLAPVLFALPGGLIIIMPRVEPATETPSMNLAGYDHKPSSYGYLNGEIVAIDYHGDVWEPA